MKIRETTQENINNISIDILNTYLELSRSIKKRFWKKNYHQLNFTHIIMLTIKKLRSRAINKIRNGKSN